MGNERYEFGHHYDIVDLQMISTISDSKLILSGNFLPTKKKIMAGNLLDKVLELYESN